MREMLSKLVTELKGIKSQVTTIKTVLDGIKTANQRIATALEAQVTTQDESGTDNSGETESTGT